MKRFFAWREKRSGYTSKLYRTKGGCRGAVNTQIKYGKLAPSMYEIVVYDVVEAFSIELD